MSISAAVIEARIRQAEPHDAVAWTADCSATVHLDRLTGPAHGLIDPPGNLLADGPRSPARAKWDIDRLEVKRRLYRMCLTRGCAFDIYRWVNLPDLVMLWNSLELPRSVALPWERAFAQLGLISSPTPAPSVRPAV